MSEAAVQTFYRADYEPTEYATETIELTFELGAEATQVTAKQRLRRREPLAGGATGRLVLDGQELELLSVAVNGNTLGNNEYQVNDEHLVLEGLPEHVELCIETRIYPDQNTALEGLYRSSGMYCTQCEAEGFRKITYYQDRPDVLARFTTHIIADGERYPVLLANGNQVGDETLPDGRRRVSWEDPFLKPSYLFALVAGDLASIEDSFRTMSGRDVRLVIYSEPHNIEQCHYAMAALKRSMAWDETAYGREYDLDLFMIVAVDDFNMGAMENKGLNIFNTSCVLATPETATDAAHQRVEAVVAHEYFHNWSGNRVTCRDWFQLSLKEGFTVFRDAQFSAAMNGATAKRIEDVNFLRSVQFAEDAGPLAHPVRPDSYQEISNFYTVTIYEKGAEVVRMLHTLLGPEGFRAGSDLYFNRHDGEAATVEDFVRAMEDANDQTFDVFRRWYSQPGTPLVSVKESFSDGTLTLELTQAPRQMPDAPPPAPQHIPIVLGLLDTEGRPVPLDPLVVGGTLDARPTKDGQESLLANLTEPSGTLTFAGLSEQPEVSLLRGFSAPVRVSFERPPTRLARLARHDVDGFARWDGLQSLLVDTLLSEAAPSHAMIVDLFGDLLQQLAAVDDAEGLSLYANMLSLPSEAYLFEQAERIDVAQLVARRDALLDALASTLEDHWLALYQRFSTGAAYEPTPQAMAGRLLKNLALEQLSLVEETASLRERVLTHLNDADNLTDRSAALRVLCSSDRLAPALRQETLSAFHDRWQAEALVINLWFQLQATATQADVLTVRALLEHPSYDSRNPNKVRSVVSAFAGANARNFHRADGSGYRFLAEQAALIDKANPQLAARIVQPLSRWSRYVPALQEPMRAALASLLDGEPLSRDLSEIVTKSL